MNCEQIAAILDDGDAAGVTEATRTEIDAHLRSCAKCRADWQVHGWLAAKAAPPISAHLPERIWRSLPADAVAGSGRRSVILPLLLLAGAAAAMLALLSTFDSEQNAEPAATVDVEVASTPDTQDVTVVDGAEEPAADAVASEDPEVAAEQPRHRIAIWPIQYDDEATAAVQQAEAAHRAVVRFFSAQANLEVIETTAAQWDAVRAAVGDIENPGQSVTAGVAMLGPRLIRAMAGELGAEYSVQVASGSLGGPGSWSIGLRYVGPTVTGSGGSGGGNGDDLAAALNYADSVGTDLAQRAYARMFPDAGAQLIEAVVTDSARSDAERLDAIDTLLRSAPRISAGGVMRRGEISPAALAAAVELGRSSASAETRRRVWQQLGQTGNAQLAQPLTDTLLYDPDEEVRAVAADALTVFRAEPAVRAALESVAVGEGSPELRLRARWSALDDAERASYVSATLLDPVLSTEERMAPVILARTRRPTIPGSESRNAEIPALEGEALDAIARIASGNHDDSIRRAALFELGYAGHADFVSLMFDGTDAALRRSVLIELSNRRGTPGIAERIAQVLGAEPDAGVRQMMETLLAPPGSRIQPPTVE